MPVVVRRTAQLRGGPPTVGTPAVRTTQPINLRVLGDIESALADDSASDLAPAYGTRGSVDLGGVLGYRLVAADRFRGRRRELQSLPVHHPESDVDEDSVDEIASDALARLADIAADRPGAATVLASATLDETYRAMLATLDDRTN